MVVGDEDLWSKAESHLEEALNSTGRKWQVNSGDGAFYGPKIDVTVTDSMGRRHQTATIQLDFQLPLRFDLKYMDDQASAVHPVIVHRAILGSMERMLAIIIENNAGRWPLWLSPRQIKICSVNKDVEDYCIKVRDQIYAKGFHVDVDTSGTTLGRKIRAARMMQYNYIVVVGPEEAESSTISVRARGESSDKRGVDVDQFIVQCKEEVAAAFPHR